LGDAEAEYQRAGIERGISIESYSSAKQIVEAEEWKWDKYT
jgi:hypothetical protein